MNRLHCRDLYLSFKRSRLLKFAGKYFKADLPQRKIIRLIKRTSRIGLKSGLYNYKSPISVNPWIYRKEQ